MRRASPAHAMSVVLDSALILALVIGVPAGVLLVGTPVVLFVRLLIELTNGL